VGYGRRIRPLCYRHAGAGLERGTGAPLPPLDRVVDYQPRQPLQVLTADGVEIAQFGSERRLFVPIAQMPRLLQDAVLAIEDTGFHDHPGISLRKGWCAPRWPT
jgi:membrane carboxypeptidase/penicillin-binding protein